MCFIKLKPKNSETRAHKENKNTSKPNLTSIQKPRTDQALN